MQSDENRLFLLGLAAVIISGMLWGIPGINGFAAVLGIAGLMLTITRLGYARGIMISLLGLIFAATSSMAALGLEAGILFALLYMIVIMLPGFAMGNASRSFASAGQTVWRGFIPILVMMVLLSSSYIEILRNMPAHIKETNAAVTSWINSNPRLSSSLSAQFSGNSGWQDNFLAWFDKFVELSVKLMPATLILGFLAIIILGVALCGAVAKRFKVMVPRFRPFYLWRASDWWLLPTIIGLAAVIFGIGDLLRFGGGNLLLLSGNIYAVAGFAVTEAFLRRMMLPMWAKVIFYVIIILGGFFSLVPLALLGLADSRFNFKRENENFENENINVE